MGDKCLYLDNKQSKQAATKEGICYDVGTRREEVKHPIVTVADIVDLAPQSVHIVPSPSLTIQRQSWTTVRIGSL